jgi:hypothetical protein
MPHYVILLRAAAFGALCLIMGTDRVSAAPKDCGVKPSAKQRALCYDEQPPNKQPAKGSRAAMEAELERIERETERILRRLKGICRGC